MLFFLVFIYGTIQTAKNETFFYEEKKDNKNRSKKQNDPQRHQDLFEGNIVGVDIRPETSLQQWMREKRESRIARAGCHNLNENG